MAKAPDRRGRGNDPFRDFFGDEYFNPYGQQPGQSAGSGVIISQDGYIVTNNHVVENADEIEVTLQDKRTFKAKVVGTDPSTDLAVLEIKAVGLPFLTFANSDAVRVGEWVLAVGNPFNLESTVTAGIVSAKGRNINILKDNYAIESFIQTDAAVNPGNSGGALVNLQGELIGINTAIASPNGAFAGYSFAVPSSIVKKITEDLLKYGSVQRGFLGVMIRSVDGNFAKEKNLLMGPGRGSSPSSIVIYGLGFGKIDPTKHNLIPERLSRIAPDVHIDVEFEKGQEFVDYCRE
ncbi:MAG: trypsin-like peptidase domain-containing protein, partial [Cytophagales bacterium]|nr:trypsin-like peptidase domain-containing protein [Cytophagales bacterium]